MGNWVLAVSALACFGLSTVIPNSIAGKSPGRAAMEPKEFDVLDGHGASRKKVDVVEWENNLEIHVYPKGSLRSLGMKIDRTKKDHPVMVIEYGLTGVAYTLIRRAVLSIPLKDGFKSYRDASADDYDKVILSNNTLAAGGLSTYALAEPPTQLYPDYHPALGQDAGDALLANQETAVPASDEPAQSYDRKVASDGARAAPAAPGVRLQKTEEFQQDATGTIRRRSKTKANPDSAGNIREFAF